MQADNKIIGCNYLSFLHSSVLPPHKNCFLYCHFRLATFMHSNWRNKSTYCSLSSLLISEIKNIKNSSKHKLLQVLSFKIKKRSFCTCPSSTQEKLREKQFVKEKVSYPFGLLSALYKETGRHLLYTSLVLEIKAKIPCSIGVVKTPQCLTSGGC